MKKQPIQPRQRRMTKFVVAGLLLLGTGCVAVENYPRLDVDALWLSGDSGAAQAWADVVAPLPEIGFGDPVLPSARLYLPTVIAPLRWLEAYDFNGNRTLDTGELTQAWIVTAASASTNMTFPANALATRATVDASTQDQALRGVWLTDQASRTVRKVLSRTGAGRLALANFATQFARLAGEGPYLGGE